MQKADLDIGDESCDFPGLSMRVARPCRRVAEELSLSDASIPWTCVS